MFSPSPNESNIFNTVTKNINDVVCWDWYWFEFWNDGSVTATFMYSECVNDTPCWLNAIGGDGKIAVFSVDCFNNGGGSGDNQSRFAEIVINTNPKITGNDSTKVQGSFYVEGNSGLFTYANWSGSIGVKMPKSYLYNEQHGSATISNSPTPIVKAVFLGTVYVGPGLSFDTGISRTYTYTQAFNP